MRLVGVETADEGWLCIDSCSSQTRYYHSALGVDATAEAVAEAFRDRGYDVEVRRCPDPCQQTSSAMDTVVWDIDVDRRDIGGWALVGPRPDGAAGVEILLVADG